MTTTEALINELQVRADADGSWEVTADELSDRYDSVDFYRAQYESGQVGTDVFGPDNVGELLLLLDLLTGRDYRGEFRDAGLFLTHDDRVELTERFVRAVRHAVVLHTPEPETFRAMLREFRRYDRAKFAYLRTYFPHQDLVEQCVREYLELRDAPALRATVAAYLHLLLQRHIVDVEDLAPALMEILRTVARHEGMLPGGRTHGERDADDAAGGRSTDGTMTEVHDRRQALAVLGIANPQPSKREVRDRYRTLMRKYHPDVNPDGLETAKTLNNAYGLLIGGAE
ncbi:MAG: J domain-containing protein [Spirochaetota bacterium]